MMTGCRDSDTVARSQFRAVCRTAHTRRHGDRATVRQSKCKARAAILRRRLQRSRRPFATFGAPRETRMRTGGARSAQGA
ncbi:serine protease, kumamolysin domain protein [Burkholderia thailandensis]|uniref:Serine protease, kumamolysin domain protein n=1 Tax=Burkholderia thailandensis TaxID=57975 RepID=A0AAW9CZS7_BURTH|nr:serine protease, kumamolysin domain protein [Burkholderia thailandensis]MDW9253254.1 serine protease, kumamolysin domain protein [Burkholderia thailandensis]